MKKFLVFTFLLFISQLIVKPVMAQLTVDGSLTPQQLVQTVLVGNGVSATNVTYTGAPAAIGSFNGIASNIGFANGIILTTGSISNAPGPNNNTGAETDHGRPGDAQLTQVSGQLTNDASILEFDFIPLADTLRFNYVFASEEYPEWVNSNFNDVFGFFISGPGIVGSQNIALIPGTTTGVTISGVNNGNAAFCPAAGPCTNCQFFVENCNGPTVQYDGFTVPLIAQAVVQCGETYHIKLAIADAEDGNLDSGVFLEAGSFGTSGIQLSAEGSASGDSIIVEGCEDALFTFFRPDTSSDFVMHFFIEGTATPGVDYNQIPDSIIIPQGQFTEELVVSPFVDGISDSTETIIVRIDFFSGCGNDTIYATIYIKSVDSLKVVTGEDANICTPGEFAALTASATGGYGALTYTWSNGAGTGDSVMVEPIETTKYFVTVTDSCGNMAVSDSIEVIVQCDVIVPNVFTPNGDSFNDKLFILNLDQYPGSSIKLYNRWGRQVYESEDYQNDWDGEKLAEGIYFYVLTVPDPDQGIKTGHVTILRN